MAKYMKWMTHHHRTIIEGLAKGEPQSKIAMRMGVKTKDVENQIRIHKLKEKVQIIS